MQLGMHSTKFRQLDFEKFGGVEVAALPSHSQMKMGAGGATAGTAQCDELTAANLGADLHFDLREVHVDAHQAEAMVDDDATSLKVERLR
jgi:hypothetical protein